MDPHYCREYVLSLSHSLRLLLRYVISNHTFLDARWVEMGDDDRCPLTVVLTHPDWNVCFDCLQELVENGHTLDPRNKVTSLLSKASTNFAGLVSFR